MRALLMSVMLLIAAVVIYMQTIGGETGAKKQIRESGQRINQTIEQINP